MIEWFAKNPVAANLLMIGIVLAGLASAINEVPIELFPSDEPNSVSINTEFRGATPQNVEQGITLRVEEAIADIEGIEDIQSRSSEGRSAVTIEVNEAYQARDVLDDIKVRVDALNTLPIDAEKPAIALRTRERSVLDVALEADSKVSTQTMRLLAEQFRESLLTQSQITTVRITGVPSYQMNIDVSPETLQRYGLGLDEIGQAIRNGASDVSAGSIQSSAGDILVRSNGQVYSAAEFARIPVLNSFEGKPVTLGDIATIDDGFEETPIITRFNGNPAVLLEVFRVGDQSAFKVAEQTHATIAEFTEKLPPGVSLNAWRDRSVYLQSRAGAVLNSALYGGLLVIALLSLFLRPAVAFWVFLGIPVSFMGAFLFMPHVDGTFNLISLFAFILVLGIVVDDAIVTGENIYRHIRDGMDPRQASIVGTHEIAVPVTFGVITTAVAFVPLLFMEGTRFAFIAGQMPLVVIPVLLMSLVESKLVLPSHMSHVALRSKADQMGWLGRSQQKISRLLEGFVEHRYRPFLKTCLDNQIITVAVLACFSIVVVAALYLGQIKVSPFPRIQGDSVRVDLVMPESTGIATTEQYVDDIVKHFKAVQEKYTDPESRQSVIKHVLSSAGTQGGLVGPNYGRVTAELQTATDRIVNVSANQLSRELRQLIGEIPGAQSLSYRAFFGRFVPPINIVLKGERGEHTPQIINRLKEKLAAYPGVFDVQDNFTGGKEEFTLQLKPKAYSLGFRLRDVADQVRFAVFGFQAQRIQRDRNELRVMLRYPLADRSSISDLNELKIRVPGTQESVLLSDIAQITPSESPTTLFRSNRDSVVNVMADIDEDHVDSALIVQELEPFLKEIQQRYPDFSYEFDGDAKDSQEANAKLMLGLALVLAAIYALLAIPFKSYAQPLVVMSVIPFGLIGAVVGHVVIGQTLTLLSMFGMLALIGVMVNDSLVLVDYINKRRAQGLAVIDAVVSAACIRFRPVILTSITTFAGLTPILLDKSQQAKWLKPMATSLGFGIVFATIVTLIMVPVIYVLGRRFKYATRSLIGTLWQFWLDFWNHEENKEDKRRV